MPNSNRKNLRVRLNRIFTFIEEFGNSLALYSLLLLIITGAWFASPLPSPQWSMKNQWLPWLAFVFISFSALHGLFWWIITREFLDLPTQAKQFLSSSIKLVKPVHMLTGMLGLGFSFLHGLSHFQLSANIFIASGIIALITLFILTIDGIGLMISPFLSRAVHRWIAAVFVLTIIIHLFIIFS